MVKSSLAVSRCIQSPWAMYYLTGARDLFGVRHYTKHRHPLGQSPRRLPNVQGDVPRLGWWRTDTIQRAALLRTKRAHLWRKPRTTLSCPVLTFALLEQLDRCIIHKDGLGLKHMIAGGI